MLIPILDTVPELAFLPAQIGCYSLTGILLDIATLGVNLLNTIHPTDPGAHCHVEGRRTPQEWSLLTDDSISYQRSDGCFPREKEEIYFFFFFLPINWGKILDFPGTGMMQLIFMETCTRLLVKYAGMDILLIVFQSTSLFRCVWAGIFLTTVSSIKLNVLHFDEVIYLLFNFFILLTGYFANYIIHLQFSP